MSGYNLLDIVKIDSNVTFIRIEALDIKTTLSSIFISLSQLAWIHNFDEAYKRQSFAQKANDTIKYISKNIIKGHPDEVTKNSGELCVAELSRISIIKELNYADIPLAELIKVKDMGNHGFDFYSINTNEIILFAEAKFLSNQNAYGKALKQLVKFEKERQDVSDITDIDKFCSPHSLRNFEKGNKGFIAAFATKSTKTETIIKGISKNVDFKKMKKFDELICIGVNI